MSKISLTPNASGTGTFTIASPDSNTNRTLTLPDADGALLSDGSSLNSSNLTGALPAIDGSALTGVGASTTAGDVGTYAYLINTVPNIGITPAATTAGSSLRYSAQSTSSNTSASGYSLGHTYSSGPSGTWQAMGGRTTTTLYAYPATLYVRIA